MNCDGHAFWRAIAVAAEELAGLPWLGIFRTLASVAVAFIAWRALRTWRQQEKAKRQTDFLDQLTETVHDFIGTMPAPVTMVQFIKIGMESHRPMEQLKSRDSRVAGAIEYIERRGDEDAKRLSQVLEPARPIATRLRALATKGRVFKFQNYETCQNAVAILVWQFTRTQALATFMRNPNWYWENDEVVEQLKKLMTIEPSDIQSRLESSHAEIITYVGEVYGRIYG
jgi:hypothetical protein